MSSKIYIKRSSVAGKVPNTSILDTGELALNLKDGRAYSSNGTNVFEIGSNVHSLYVGAGGATFGNGAFSLPTVDASSNGLALISYANGTTYWGSVSAGGISIEGADQKKVLRSNSSIIVLLDTDNNDSTSIFQIRKDTNAIQFGDNLFEVRSDGRTKINDAYSLPNYDGNAGEALLTDGSGGLSWGGVASSDELDDILSRNSQVSSNVFFNSNLTSNNLFVEGDLFVTGNVTTISSEILNVDTNFIVLNANLSSSIPPLLDAGITINRGSSTNASLYWDESGKSWHMQYGGGTTLIDRKIPATLHDVLTNGFASNNNMTVNGITRLEDARIVELTINNDYTLPLTDGNYTQVLATYGNGSLYWAISNNELRTSIGYTATNFTANTGQQIFTGQDDDGIILRYEVGKTSVYMNGIKLKLNIDYVATDGQSVVLAEPASNGDIVMVDCFGYQDTMQFGNTSIINTLQYQAANNTEQVIDSFIANTYSSATLFIQAKNPDGIHTTTLNVAHDRGNVFLTEFGTLISNGSLMTLDADANNSMVRILATPVSSSVKFSVHRTSMRG